MGAKGDGVTDDTAAIQAAVDAIAGSGGTVLVPTGTYLVDANESVRLKSDMTFRMDPAAVLKAIPNDQQYYVILLLKDVSHVNVVGGSLVGERSEHLGAGGEWGFGLRTSGASDVAVENVLARDCWGDGFYVGVSSSSVKLCAVTADNNRRQGLSITSADGVLVRNSVFKNTNGTPPESGIDIEPNQGETVNDVQILGSRFLDNASHGILLWGGATSSTTAGVVVDGNTFSGNAGAIRIGRSNAGRYIDNQISETRECAILLDHGSTGNTIRSNAITVSESASGKAICGAPAGNSISNNSVTDNGP